MIRLVEGFDAVVLADLSGIFSTVGGFTDTQTTTVRNGARALQTQQGGLGAIRFSNTPQSTGIVGFGFRGNALNGRIFSFMDAAGQEQVTLRGLADGRLELYRGNGTGIGGVANIIATSTSSITTNTWYYIEYKLVLDAVAGSVEVRVNGSATGWIPPVTGINTVRTSGTAAFTLYAWEGVFGGITFYDDIYCGDDLTDFQGDRKVITVVASSGDGPLAEFTPLSGTDNGAMVDELTPDGDTTYNASATVGHRDTYNFAALGATGLIAAVELVNVVKKSDVGAREIAGMARIGGVEYVGASKVLSTSYVSAREVWENSPATGIPWTVAEVDAADFGLKILV